MRKVKDPLKEETTSHMSDTFSSNQHPSMNKNKDSIGYHGQSNADDKIEAV